MRLNDHTLKIGLIAAMLIAYRPAEAASPGYSELMKVRNACSKDIKIYCADVPAGKGRIMMCLKVHKNELSQACIEASLPYADYAEKLAR